MPSRKLTAHCSKCGCKNHLRANFCNQCGQSLKNDPAFRDHQGRTKLYADIAHPINSECREMIQSRVIQEFEAERERAKQPGYVSRYDEPFADEPPSADEPSADKPPRRPSPDITAQVQPPEPPQGPHQPPQRKADKPQTHSQRRHDDNFGAGIF